VSQSLIYVTTKNRKEAMTIAHEVIKTNYAACANIFGETTSVYCWEDKIFEEKEVLLILKTRESLVKSLIEKVKNLHSYDCPCVISLPINGGNKDFLNWINRETSIK
jgi:periplasmic divalent cation tolerance protein